MHARCALVLSLILVAGQALSAIIPADRLTPWYGNVGVPGGIPNRTTLFVDATKPPYSADNTGANDASGAINSAIKACPPNQYVYLPPGTYRIASSISFPSGTTNVTLRGAGNSTVLKNVTDSECVHFGNSGWPIGVSNPVSWTGGLAQGSTVLTVSSVAQFIVGELIWLTQDDDTSLVWSDGGVGTGVNGNIKELKRVVAINPSANQITIDTPVIWTQWNPAFHPIVTTDSANNVCVGCSLESVKIDGSSTTGGYSIYMEESYGCWLLNVYSYMAYGYNMEFYNCARCEVRRVTLWDAQIHAENCGGFVLSQTCTSCLFEDNIMYRQFPGVESDAACLGNAFLYNFSDQAVWMPGTPNQSQGYSFDSNHGAHGCMNLYEGNYGNNIIDDGYHGSGSHFTFFRNRMHGYDETGDTSNSLCLHLDRWSLYNNVVGNVFGVSGFSNVYDEKTNNYPGSDHMIVRFGFPNMGNGSFSGYRPSLTYAQDAAQGFQALDEAARPTSEWNKDGASYPPNTAGTVRGTTIMEGNWDPINANPVWNDSSIGPQTIPASLYYPSKPAYFGPLAWPPFDPLNPGDTSASNVPAGGSAIPAGYRFNHNGADPVTLTSTSPNGGASSAGILWQNSSTGSIALWLMQGTTITATQFLGNFDPSWKIAGIGSFNGDGKNDILWYNAQLGVVGIWTMDGTTPTGSYVLRGGSPDWDLAAVADFDHTGFADILWRQKSTGDVYLWKSVAPETFTTIFIASVDLTWQFSGIADIEGSGSPDLIWRDTATGGLAIWQLVNDRPGQQVFLGNYSLDFVIAGFGDFNGDGKADILWRNQNTGDVYVWLMNGFSAAGVWYAGQASLAWQIVATPALAGDGTSDILWTNTADGSVAAWLGSPGGFTKSAPFASVGAGWRPMPALK